VDRSQGLHLDLIWNAYSRSDGLVHKQAMRGGRVATDSGARRSRWRSSLDLELRCTILSAVSTYMMLRSSQTYRGGLGGGSGNHDDAPWPVADGRPRHMAATALIAPGARKKKGGRFLTLMRSCWRRRERQRSGGEGDQRRRVQAWAAADLWCGLVQRRGRAVL
jgi:hypothetical protein